MLIAIASTKKGMISTILPAQVLAQGFLVWAMVVFFAPLLYAQDINIRVLNGRNGKPITNECLNVWVGTRQRTHMVAATSNEGVALLHIADNDILAETACPGWVSRASRRTDMDGITVSGDRYIACQEYAKILPGEPPTDPLTTMPYYPIKKILESGISAANTCGKFRAEARPGELIFYVRPRTFSERMKL
jgi:hypothetical protein